MAGGLTWLILYGAFSLMCAVDQQFAFSAFMHDSHKDQRLTGAVFRTWFAVFQRRCIYPLVFLIPGGVVLQYVNLCTLPDELVHSRRFYLLGLFFTAAHLAFATFALKGIARSQDPKLTPVENLAAMRAWLRMNLARMLVADFPALVCQVLAMVCLLH